MMTAKLLSRIPITLLALSLVFSVLSYFEVYHDVYKYLGDLVGYSFATNLFMLLVFMNKRYCITIKISVIALLFLNLFNILYMLTDVNGSLYDFIVCLGAILTIIFYKLKQ